VVEQNGNFTIDSNVTATMSATSDTFNQNAGTLSVLGTLSMGGATFDYAGGAVTGTVNLGSSSSLTTLTLGSGAGNSGTFLFTGAGGDVTTNTSTISIQSGQTLIAKPTSSTGSLQLLDATNNAGTVDLIGSSPSHVFLNDGGTFTNSGTLTFSATGSPTSVADFVEAVVLNAGGTENVQAATEFESNATNNGTFDISAGATMSFEESNYGFTQNGGTLTIAGVLSMPDNNFDYRGR
jgi:hypothetical protein